MSGRELSYESAGEPSPTNLVLRSPPNWTAVCFFGGLGALHLTIWGMAIAHGKTEGYMSLVFGVAFLLNSLASYLTCFEVAVLPAERRVRLRTGYRQLRLERSIPFSQVHGVRLTLTPDPDHKSGRVDLLCNHEDIACPPTSVARVEALCLAVTMGVRLIKVTDGQEAPVRRRRRRMWRSAKVAEVGEVDSRP